MKLLQTGSVLAATTMITLFPLGKSLVAAEYGSGTPGASVVSNHSSQSGSTALPAEEAIDHGSAQTTSEANLSYLAFYPYAELPPARKPADIVLESLRAHPGSSDS